MAGLLIAQGMVEYGALSSFRAGLARLRSEIEAYIGSGNSGYLLAGVLILVVYLLIKRRR